jgi:hypothetical protein
MKKTEFDSVIKNNVMEKEGEAAVIYVTASKAYDNYYSKEFFDKFQKEMSEKYSEYYKFYADGAGGELKEKQLKGTWIPPKMASVASSSRLCYCALRDGAEVLGGNTVKFEYECKIEDIAAMTYPQLDAYIEESHTFIEAKCHEIFDSHKVELSEKYKPYITEDFGIKSMVEQDKKIKIDLSEFGIKETTSRFDIKQLLCHLIGIKSEMKKLKLAESKLTYLYFIPISKVDKENEQIKTVFGELKEEINKIFNSNPIRKFTEDNHIKLDAIAERAEIMEALTKENVVSLM